MNAGIADGTRAGTIDQAQLPLFRLLLGIQALAAAVFGLVPLVAPAQFAQLTGYSGSDEVIYRLAGAATTGYLLSALLAIAWRTRWAEVRIPVVATATFNLAAVAGCIVSASAGDEHRVVLLVLAAAGVFSALSIGWLARDRPGWVQAGSPIETPFRAIIVLATLSAAVFGIAPLVDPERFASLFGLVGTDAWIYRMAGAACLGYATAGILEAGAGGYRTIRLQNVAAIAFNATAAVAAWLAVARLSPSGEAAAGGLLAPVVAGAATFFAVTLTIFALRAERRSSAGTGGR
ncbi:MAG TPA: hypothetical protein VIV06_11565 [Candidatus Limnocylindrales bacterium]